MKRTGRSSGRSRNRAGDAGYEHFAFGKGVHGMSGDDDDRWIDEQVGPGPAEVARSNAADLAAVTRGTLQRDVLITRGDSGRAPKVTHRRNVAEPWPGRPRSYASKPAEEHPP